MSIQSEMEIRQRAFENQNVFNLDGKEIDFKTNKVAPKTKMTNLTAFTIEK
jgi:hypothetical protein